MNTYLVTLIDESGKMKYIAVRPECGCPNGMQEFVDSLDIPGMVNPTVVGAPKLLPHVPADDDATEIEVSPADLAV